MDEAQPAPGAAAAAAPAGDTERPQQQTTEETTRATPSSQAPPEPSEDPADQMDTDPPPPAASIAEAAAAASPREGTEKAAAAAAPAAAASSSAPSQHSSGTSTTAAAPGVDTGGGGAAPPRPPASPPLPARPTAVAPGPRAARLQRVLDDSLRHTLGRVGYDNFAACFPTVAARAPATLRAAQRQMVDRLGLLCRQEFAAILEGRHVVAKLNELEALVAEAERRRDEAGPVAEADLPVPPHLLPADAVLAAHLRPHLAASQSQLNARLQTTQAHNARLWADVRRQRADLAALAAALDRLAADLDSAGAMLDDARVDALARETRDVEAELLATAPAAADNRRPQDQGS